VPAETRCSLIDFKLVYQTVVFLDASDLGPKPNIVVEMVEAFRDKEFIPGNYQEIIPPTTVQTRLRMSSPNNEWQVDFGLDRIQISKNILDIRGDNLGNLRDFCGQAVDLYGRVFGKIKKKAYRLSLLTSFLLKEMTVADLEAIYLKLFKTTSFYTENSPIEWIWKSVARTSFEISGLKEQMNVLSTVDRVKGGLGSPEGTIPIDRIRISMDLNTIAETNEHRFEMVHLTDFFNQMPGLHDSLLDQITELVNG
jgi:hypothetical protein